MSYFFRRKAIAKANPWHDEIGRFTTAANAVMFVRPKSGYHGNDETIDPNWRGRYAEGERYEPRRRSQADSDASYLHTSKWINQNKDPETKDQMSLGLPEPEPSLKTPTPDAAAAPALMLGMSADPSARTAIDSVGESVGKLLPTTGIDAAQYYDLKTAAFAELDIIRDNINAAGHATAKNWGKAAGAGINPSILVTLPDGSKYQLKAVTDSYGIGAKAEAIGPMLVKELDIGVRVQEVRYVRANSGIEYALTEWVDGKPPKDAGANALVRAIENTGPNEVMKLMMFEALAGDSDKHIGNYVISDDKKLVAMDYSRMGDYESSRAPDWPGFQSVVLNTMEANDAKWPSFKSSDFKAHLDAAYKRVRETVIPQVPVSGTSNNRKITPSGGYNFNTTGRAEALKELNWRFAKLSDILASDTFSVATLASELRKGASASWPYTLGN